MKKSRIRIRDHGYRFFIFTIIITIFVLVLSVSSTFFSFYKLAKNDAVSIGEKAIYETAEHLNNFLLKGVEMMTVASQTVEFMLDSGASVDEIESYLKHANQSYRNESSDVFTGIYGMVREKYVDGDGWVPDESFNPEEREWYVGAWWKPCKTAIIQPYFDVKTGKIIISVARLLHDWSILSMDIQLDELQTFIENMNFTGSSFIIDRSGMVVAHSDKNQIGRNILKERNERKSNYAMQLVRSIYSRSEKGTKSDRIVIDDEKCIVFSQQVLEDWFVVEVVNESQLFSKVKINLIRNIVLSLLIFIIIAYFCTVSLVNKMRSKKLADLLEEHQKSLNKTIEVQTQKIVNQTKELLDFQQSVIEGVAQLIESRDGSTGEHVRNSKKYVLRLVNYLYENEMYTDEIDDKFVEVIGNAATLHDVGKIHIQDSILNKSAQFTDAEYEIMKKHADYGGDVVETIFRNSSDERLVKITYDTVKYHHEKWNGTGYPEKLRETDIPLCARIMTIADVYDALLAKRAYKDSIPYEDVIEIMNRDSGKAFDPNLLKIFLKLSGPEDYRKEH